MLLNIKGCADVVTIVPDTSFEGVKTSVETCVRLIGGNGRIHQFEPARKDKKVEIEDTVRALQAQVDAGNIGGISLSEVSAATIRRAAKVAKIQSVEVELSLWATEPLENGVTAACAELGIPILAYCEFNKSIISPWKNDPILIKENSSSWQGNADGPDQVRRGHPGG